MFGLEIELITDREKLFAALQKNDIPYINYNRMKTPTHDILVIKNETTLKDDNGLEINFPPSDNFNLIKQVLDILNELDVKFNPKCALHVHVGVDSESDLEPITQYYIEHQNEIIEQAGDLYVNLNKTTRIACVQLLLGKFYNLNVRNAFSHHKTVEHRIYRSTINFDEVKFCINQTLDIINKALNRRLEDK